MKVFVEDGNVTLEGKVDWDFQRRSAAKAIWNIEGVCWIDNNIKVTIVAAATDLKEKIELTFKRRARHGGNKIDVGVNGHQVMLSSKVNSWDEKLEAEKAVWWTMGVDKILNQIQCDDESV